MKRPQTKFHADTMSHSKDMSKKSQDLSLGLNFLAAKFFLVIDILLKWQQQIFICFCKFSRNFEEVVGSLRLLTE